LTVGIKYGQNPGNVVGFSNGKFLMESSYDPSVRVPDYVLKSVGFIGEVHRNATQQAFLGDLYASGFFVGVPCSDERVSQLWSCYFVTAKHVALDLQGKEIYFLVNKRGGRRRCRC
jgi:hypothetical protein